MSFHVGQKVVCVGGWKKPIENSIRPVTGNVYTVRWVGQRPTDQSIGIMLEEHFGGLHPLHEIEYCFNFASFRPVIERKTDISVFTAMLTPNKKRVRV